MKERYFDDLKIGDRFKSGPLTVTEKEVIEFAHKFERRIDNRNLGMDGHSSAQRPDEIGNRGSIPRRRRLEVQQQRARERARRFARFLGLLFLLADLRSDRALQPEDPNALDILDRPNKRGEQTRRGRGMFIKDGAAKLLLTAERARFLAEQWPAVRATMLRLGLKPEDLLRDATPKPVSPQTEKP